MELGKFNIRVNAVCPGTIKGDRMKRVIKDKAKFTKVSTKTIEKDIYVEKMPEHCLRPKLFEFLRILIDVKIIRVERCWVDVALSIA